MAEVQGRKNRPLLWTKERHKSLDTDDIVNTVEPGPRRLTGEDGSRGEPRGKEMKKVGWEHVKETWSAHVTACPQCLCVPLFVTHARTHTHLTRLSWRFQCCYKTAKSLSHPFASRVNQKKCLCLPRPNAASRPPRTHTVVRNEKLL